MKRRRGGDDRRQGATRTTTASTLASLAFLAAAVVLAAVLAACTPATTTTSGSSTGATARSSGTKVGAGQPDAEAGGSGAAPVEPGSAGGPSLPGDAQGPFRVVDVVDGDTIKVDRDGRKETLRLIGLDTPETKDPRKPVQCFGREASARAKALLTGQQVRLTVDPSQGTKDKYDRTLAYVWLPDGRLYNWVMIADGYAHEYTYDLPYRYLDEFKAAERTAREQSRGLWAPDTCAGDTTKPA